ncbi:hypothetical protein IJG96_03100 [Candidatus Saccharibacteria bacterium]|nr:hypothetical protein [Candidatus Saccharibacteria bacterium]
MVLDLSKISGIGDYDIEIKQTFKQNQPAKSRTVYKKGTKTFLVENDHTLELRTDEQLAKTLIDKYESVMESRYFGRGGIEIVTSARQLAPTELDDLIRLSYNLTN